MDLETENRIATILLKEAAELRRQAEKEGVHVYLQKPQVRGRPNSRFLTATVLGVQQANRAVEVNEMWRIRQKELELDDRLKGRSRHENSSSTSKRHATVDDNTGASCSSSKRISGNCYSKQDEGLRDDEVEEFLHSRVKRGRGAVGSRMDETGPYLLPCTESKEKPSTSLDLREHRVVLGPEKPSSVKSYESSEEELDEDRRKKAKKAQSRSSDKHSKKHRKKERSRDKKKSRKEKRNKR
ncbi:hypothetical protein P3X46_013625 [Hevea brasiliensis]|uniref:Uncharacterized protein n=1 Tax=Hevea brasiliensis TaxID=3981 RepID=A0ABQ9M435_HEVBR|nr:uncharacterized protein LOC110644658 [Hevea brasiliensis]XP_021653242.2 uncharacterized protein LOC110644658 [Hevea brasiliensis]KAJ9175038.1 hypothetical protein P3X46_013625 [Hevea brasiliensis]KAJ9175039.1 hypothetical protein P3X46_013625 [Hevea brasiliensis]